MFSRVKRRWESSNISKRTKERNSKWHYSLHSTKLHMVVLSKQNDINRVSDDAHGKKLNIFI